MVYTNSGGGSGNVRVDFSSGGAIQSAAWASPQAGVGWQTFSFELVPTTATPELNISAYFGMNAYISSLSVVAASSVMNFDSADKRFNWRDDNNGKRAVILPTGGGTGANWVARASADGLTSGVGWPLRNRQLALKSGQRYQICASVKREGTTTVFQPGLMRLLSAGAVQGQVSFYPSSSWVSYCGTFGPLPSDDNNLQFGFQDYAGPAYLIDNISISKL